MQIVDRCLRRMHAATRYRLGGRTRRGVAPALAVLIGLMSFGHAETGGDFDDIARVLTHPRCLNCHTQADTPRQGDDRHVHRPPVRRGPAGQGVAGQRCATCHGATNSESSRVPGAAHWQMPRPSMGWEGLSNALLCRAIKDPALNGERAIAAVVEHLAGDHLVRWAWKPGAGRAPVPLSHQAFVEAVEAWAARGAPCPAE